MIMFNRDLFEQAGLDPDDPGMNTHDSFLEGCRTLIDSGVVPAAMWPSPTSEVFQPGFDFYPLYIAQTAGMQMVGDGASQFVSDDGLAGSVLWVRWHGVGV